MQPYRLEMGTPLPTERGADLYAFWGDRITDVLTADLEASPGPPVLVNLASKEYFGAVQPSRLPGRVVTPTFADIRGDGPPRSGGFLVKRARGAMAGWIVRNRVRSVRALTSFDADGYRYSPERSTADAPVFVRHHD
jgi:cytoplasmic iron level regulating protein YaaA (DUF328/UPF0246 family)